MKYLLMLSIFCAHTAFAADIDIDEDADDCVRGWVSMDVDVKVDGERFSFSPSCNFSFDDTFKTSKGLNCVVDAGMCSPFSPRGRFEVSCDDGSEEGIDITCPQK